MSSDENRLTDKGNMDNLEELIDRQAKRLQELQAATTLIKGILSFITLIAFVALLN